MPTKDQLMEELRLARQHRNDVLYSPLTTPVQRAQAHADFYATIRAAATDPRPEALSPAEIQSAAILSRQRYHQIVRASAQQGGGPSAPTEARLPETDV